MIFKISSTVSFLIVKFIGTLGGRSKIFSVSEPLLYHLKNILTRFELSIDVMTFSIYIEYVDIYY